jgi:DNA-binding HxlR family transcriptional regulator
MLRKASKQRSHNVLDPYCPSNSILQIVGGKWSLLVLYALRKTGSGRTLRYSELQRLIGGISQKMLTQTLRELERDGLLVRTLHPVVPPRTEYALTNLGSSFEGIVSRLGSWAQDHVAVVIAARRAYDLKSDPNVTA